MPKNELEQFLEDTNQRPEVDILEQPLVIPEDPAKGTEGGGDGTTTADDDEGKDGQPRNRRERRLMAKLQAERESSMFLAGKLEARSEASKALSSEEADYLKGVERIYGTDSPEAQLATDLLKKALVGMASDAEERAYRRMTDDRSKEADQLKEAEQELDNIVDEIEDEYGVTLTGAQETAFFNLLTKMSPKKNGVVVEYADPHAVWEVFQEKLKARPSPETNRAKDLSSRSMVNSGSSKESNLNDDVTARFLKEQGII